MIHACPNSYNIHIHITSMWHPLCMCCTQHATSKLVVMPSCKFYAYHREKECKMIDLMRFLRNMISSCCS